MFEQTILGLLRGIYVGRRLDFSSPEDDDGEGHRNVALRKFSSVRSPRTVCLT